MIIIEKYCKDLLKTDNYVALGSFDGLHKGHISLIEKTVEVSKRTNGKSMVFTFKNHPRSFFDKTFSKVLLMDNDRKTEVLKRNGIDILCFKTFDLHFMECSAEDFIKMLVELYNVKGIIVGFNYKFGYKNLGNISLLEKLKKKYGYELYVMEPCVYENMPISSTRIRQELLDGDLTKANDMLGYNYKLRGEVVHGRQIGRTIDFPTANLKVLENIIIPKVGVYYTNVIVNNKKYKGITNIGNNPTVNGHNITIETYILDFDKDIYDEIIEIEFILKIRDVIKFKGLNDLKEQLEKDKKFAINMKL